MTVLVTDLHIDIQRVSTDSKQPDDSSIQHWLQTTLELESLNGQIELCVRIVDESEMRALNQQYRQRSGSTNVLSFAVDKIPEIPVYMLGDLVICAPVVTREAQQQKKTLNSHWAHMVVHGVLHLCGYDHMNQIDAQQMENREMLILDKLGFSNPYEVK